MLEQCANHLNKLSSRIRFQHVPVRASVEHLRHNLIGIVHGEDEDLRRHGTSNLARSLQAIQLRHADVEDDDVGPKVDGLGHGFTPRARFAAHNPPSVPFQHGAHTLPHHVVVIGDEDPERLHGVSLSNGTQTRTIVPLSVNSTSKVPPN